MNAKLLVVIGKTTKREVDLQLPTVLGRSREADVTVVHPLISRRHCEISESDGLLMVRDLASLNGTMIAGRRVESAPLLPEAEFTIGPLTFRVLYEFDGDLEAVPEPCYVPGAAELVEAGVEDPAEAEEAPMFDLDDAELVEPPAAPAAGESSDVGDSDEVALDLMALADDEIEEVVPDEPAPAGQVPAIAPTGPKRPPATVPSGLSATDAPDEPLEVDSSLQSGGHAAESPWAAEPRPMEKPQPAPVASAGKRPPKQAEMPPDEASAEEAGKRPAKPKQKRPGASPPPPAKSKRPGGSDDMDPEFGSYLEDMQ